MTETALAPEADIAYEQLVQRNSELEEEKASLAEDVERAELREQNLAALARQLASALKKRSPESNLAARAIDYLGQQGLLGSPLRK
ncbi:hypothetical protein [Bisbaumannia pacifica]|uniref:Uncharacterized protein n=1 Tax=Bisbaumannia pacifica TaxID=77098 RepID=A0ABD4KWB7_9GAMM|nr:hypothetical protein [Halomonas pacifica]MBH8578745.1 hypothetical protein [Halomonas pacifica]